MDCQVSPPLRSPPSLPSCLALTPPIIALLSRHPTLTRVNLQLALARTLNYTFVTNYGTKTTQHIGAGFWSLSPVYAKLKTNTFNCMDFPRSTI
eukprot:7316176-Heterocapsa_arctica.AAC.1